jgi:sensor histidine kinase YesM
MSLSPGRMTGPPREDVGGRGGRWTPVVVVLAAWTALGLLESAKAYFLLPIGAPPRRWVAVLSSNMPWWLVWAALTPLVVWFASRVRMDGERHRLGAAAAHSLFAVTLSVLHIAVTAALFHWTTGGVTAPTVAILVRRWLQLFLILDLLTYAAIVGVHYAVTYARKYRASALTAARLSAQAARLRQGLVEAKLHALQRELNPHFLFNSLNAVSGLIRRREIDPAVTMLARVGDLLRETLEREETLETRLDTELRLLDLYLDVERARFGPRLTVDFDVAPEAGAALVPTLVLQPLVENAVRHGVARVPGPGRISVRAFEEAGRLTVEVRNTGTELGRGAEPANGDGIGHANTRARLAELYGARAGLTLQVLPDGDALVRLWVPYHTEPVLRELGAEVLPGSHA